MRVAVTGTPGVGKTSACAFVTSLPVVHVNDMVDEFRAAAGYDSRRKTRVVDTLKLAHAVSKLKGDMVIEGHLSHLLNPDIAIVLRCSPAKLEKRLRAKGWDEDKVRENVEAEAVDVILVEAVENVPDVLEVDATDMSPEEVGHAIEEILAGKRQKYRIGNVDWSQEVLGWF
jgi:adenylate kinase